MTITADERAAMCDLFEKVGPHAPTLCEGWTTGDLLTHLLVRERRPDVAAAVALPFLKSHARQVTKAVGRAPFATMIEQFRNGPPMWSPWAIPLVGDRANLTEFFVHHEDIRRARPDWEPRPEDPARDDALWTALKLAGRLLFRRSPVGVVLRSAGRNDLVGRKGQPHVTLVGLPGEIVLHAFGRHIDKVRVVVQGEPPDIERFAASPRGL